MMVLFDSTVLIQFLQADASPATDRNGIEVDRGKERVEYLVRKLAAAGTVICVPAPVIAEVMVLAGKGGSQYLNEMKRSSKFFLAPFDTVAAVEAWQLISYMKPRKEPGKPWSKIKFDCQIAAIAKCNQIGLIYSDDRDIAAHGERLGITVQKICDLELPPPPKPLPVSERDALDASQESLPFQLSPEIPNIPIRPRPEFLEMPQGMPAKE